jgi:hypothetical protein
MRQAQELALRTRALVRALSLVTSKDNALEMVLENGSRIVSLPGAEGTVRGYAAVDVLVLDEASRIPDELYDAVRPMLAVNEHARMVAMSTPFGMRGWWYEAWDDGGSAWERYRVPASEVPRISAAFLEGERESMGRWMFQQEYECSFVDSSDRIFRSEDIRAMLERGAGLPGLFGGAS